MTDLSGAGARVLLIATATHHGPTLTSVHSVARTFHALRAVLIERCGVRPDRLRAVLDPPDAQTMALAVIEEAQRADTVLLVYFIGHGLLGPGGELYLAASGTDRLVPGMAEHQALSFSSLRQALGASRASSVVVVLDCCFSGRASLGGMAPIPAFTMAPAHGLYLIGSAEQLAIAAPDALHTAFTGAFIDVLRQGDPRGPHLLTLDAVYDAVFRAMRDQERPLPRRQSGDRSGSLVIAPNPAAPARAQPPEEPEPTPGRCPYPGLDAFGVDDANVFFGRERMTERVLAAVAASADNAAKPGPLVLVGPSGSGKTSLLNAGLLARLRDGGLPGLPGSAGWPCLRLAPGTSPLQRLASHLGAATHDTAELLRQDPGRAAELVDVDRPGQRLIVLVDQMEELFTLCQDESERTAFLRAVTAIAEPVGDRPPRGLVLLALRADFYGQAAAHPELLAPLRDRQILVEPMTPDELRAAIEQPAAAAGLALDDGLADVILHELGASADGQPATGALPLLSHVLWATWRERAGSRLTVAGYRAVGGIAQAIATTAEQAYTALDAAGMEAMRRMFPRLVRVGEDAADTAQPVERSALVHGLPDPHAAQRAIDRFTDARLLTLDRDTARISHEALLRAWPRLREWIDSDRAGNLLRQQLEDAATTWNYNRADTSLLLGGSRLDTSREWATDHPGELSPTAAAFLTESTRHHRRTRRLRRGFQAFLSVLVLVASMLAVVAVQQGQLADQRAHDAAQKAAVLRANNLAADAQELIPTDPGLAAQLAVAAYRSSPTQDAVTQLYTTLFTPLDRVVGTLGGDVLQVAAQAHGPLAAALDGQGTIWIWDVAHPAAPVLDATFHAGTAAIAFAPRSALLAGACPGLKSLCLWNLTDPHKPVAGQPLPVPDRLKDAQAGYSSMAFSPDGTLLAFAGGQETLLWSIAEPAHPRLLADLPNPTSEPDLGLYGVAFAPRGGLLAETIQGGRTQLWSLTDPAAPTLVATIDLGYQSVAFSPDASMMAAAGPTNPGDPKLVLWNVTDPAHPARIKAVSNLHAPSYTSTVAFSPDGSQLAYSGRDTIDLKSALCLLSLSPQNLGSDSPTSACTKTEFASLWLAYTPDGAILTGGPDHMVRLWRSPLPQIDNVSGGRTDWDLSPSGHLLAARIRPAGSQTDLGPVGIWDVSAPGGPVLDATLPVPGTTLIGFLTDATLLTVARDHTVQLWNLHDPSHPTTGDALGSIPGPPEYWIKEETLVDWVGDRISVLGVDGQLHLWKVIGPGKATEVGSIPASNSPTGPAGLTGDGHTAIVITKTGIDWWDITDLAHPIRGATSPLADGAVDGSVSAGNVFAALIRANRGVDGGTLQLFEVAGGRPVSTITLDKSLLSLSISHDGRLLAASGKTKNTLTLWDISDPKHPIRSATIRTTKEVLGVTFDSTDHMMVDSSGESVRIWDIRNPTAPVLRNLITRPLGGFFSAWGTRFSPSGSTFFVVSSASLLLLDADPAKLADRLCSFTGGSITPTEWQQYAPGIPYQNPCP